MANQGPRLRFKGSAVKEAWFLSRRNSAQPSSPVQSNPVQNTAISYEPPMETSLSTYQKLARISRGLQDVRFLNQWLRWLAYNTIYHASCISAVGFILRNA